MRKLYRNRSPLEYSLIFFSVVFGTTAGSCGGGVTPIQPTTTTTTTTFVYHTGSKQLAITPVAQQTAEWCWLASAQMIFQYYGVPPVNGVSYQCGIMGAVAGPDSICFVNCSACVFGSGSDQASANVLEYYPSLVQQYFDPYQKIPQVTSQLIEGELTPTQIEQQIDAGNPVELGVTVGSAFNGLGAGHDVVLIGYSALNASTFSMVINDPFPYDQVIGPANNPYRQLGATPLQAGQWLIAYGAAQQGLQWSASILTSAH